MQQSADLDIHSVERELTWLVTTWIQNSGKNVQNNIFIGDLDRSCFTIGTEGNFRWQVEGNLSQSNRSINIELLEIS